MKTKWMEMGLTEEEFVSILEDRSRWSEIMGDEGYTSDGIHFHCRRYGVSHPTGPYSPAQDMSREEWEELLEEGLTVSAMADRLGSSEGTIRKYMEEAGLEPPSTKWQRAGLSEEELRNLLARPMDAAIQAVQEATRHLPDGPYSSRQVYRLKKEFV
jgi:transposase